MSDNDEWDEARREEFRKAHDEMASEVDGTPSGGIFCSPGVNAQRVATAFHEEIEKERATVDVFAPRAGVAQRVDAALPSQLPERAAGRQSVVDVAILCVLIVIAITLMYFVWGHR